MYCFLYFIVHICTVRNSILPIAKEQTKNIEKTFPLSPNENVFINTDLDQKKHKLRHIKHNHFNKAVREYFLNFCKNPQIKKNLDNVLANNNIKKRELFAEFKTFVLQYISSLPHFTEYPIEWTFMEYLVNRDLLSILKYANINEFYKVKNTMNMVNNDKDLTTDKDCEDIVRQLFNTKKHHKIKVIVDEKNNKNSTPFTTKRPIVKDISKLPKVVKKKLDNFVQQKNIHLI
ncbi:putative SP-containing protein [Vairimorpha necatrix]|uniref:SP-containing protein n=1 Tax=Vairimorpha necatrix TaxID=6039 RepID=A0AAX4JCP9_9MICR